MKCEQSQLFLLTKQNINAILVKIFEDYLRFGSRHLLSIRCWCWTTVQNLRHLEREGLNYQDGANAPAQVANIKGFPINQNVFHLL